MFKFIFGVLKAFGEPYVQAEFAALISKHVTSAGYKKLSTVFQEGVTGSNAESAAEVAKCLTDLLFSIN